jgi:3-oxoacyl-[acyl-carrier-protein] synthase II
LPELGAAAQISANCQPGSVDLQKWGAEGLAAMPPLWMLKYLPNMLACHVSILHDAQGPNNTITEGDVGSLLALGEAWRILGRDLADFSLVGGGDSKINPLSFVRHTLFLPMSRRNQAPEKASRPFDRGRDGIVLGEGAGVIVLEDLEHAQKRNAHIYAEVVGFASAFDSRKSGAGLVRVMQGALAEAGIGPEQVDHVNAMGYSSPEADAREAAAIREVFGTSGATVLGVKSYLGNLGAGSSLTELIASVLALENGTLPATLNYEEADPQCPVSVASQTRPIARPYALKLSFTEMGQCAAVVVRKWE